MLEYTPRLVKRFEMPNWIWWATGIVGLFVAQFLVFRDIALARNKSLKMIDFILKGSNLERQVRDTPTDELEILKREIEEWDAGISSYLQAHLIQHVTSYKAPIHSLQHIHIEPIKRATLITFIVERLKRLEIICEVMRGKWHD